MNNEMAPQYNPAGVESKVYSVWEQKKYFHAEPGSGKKPYSIVIPPPNITGVLHMGHALNNTIQDIFIRYKRMNGFETLWMPGTDHAGIATQNVVERKLRKEGRSKDQLGREKFVEEVWKWRDEYGSTIISQLKRLGASCDWDRTRFTMDEGLSDAVVEVFTRLHKKGLIYRGQYIINWCPRCKTALSDEEAEHVDVDGAFYHIKYPLDKLPGKTGNPTSDDFVIVATTRPETMLGDVAVCVNPSDERYKDLKGRSAVLPILNRKLKIIFDRTVDTKTGTGALKVTPAHDPVDFQLGITHGLESINVMNDDATINSLGGEYEGMDRFEAREAIVNTLKQMGLLVKTEPHRHAVGHCYRCHTMVEPRLSKQWFVRMAPLARPGIEAVKKGEIKFYPERWTKVYLNWMENIKDWCISRQIWWGHRLPVYYCLDCQKKYDDANPDGKKIVDMFDGAIVSKTKVEKCTHCGSADIKQDDDVLDTWFSSWLWPFSTMGWPKETAELKKFYPTDALITAQEIIFFWVARMIMSGFEFMNAAPFKDVYIHGTVRDDTGTKMSKSLGNVIDPLEIIEKFGTDALRFSIISITAQGQDVFLSPQKFEIGRNFANKLWNASRFVIMNLKPELIQKDICKFQATALDFPERWILSRFNSMLMDVSKYIEQYRINDVANRLYEFIWHEYCDWYIEMAKLNIGNESTQKVLADVLERSLKALHPIMPFITEEIWQNLPRSGEDNSIMTSAWPQAEKALMSKDVDAQMDLLIKIIQDIRNIRANFRIPPSTMIDCCFRVPGKKDREDLSACEQYLKRLARVGNVTISEKTEKPEQSAVSVIGDIEVYIPLKGIIDIDDEKKRIEKRIQELTKCVGSIDGKLTNKNFVERAPKEIIEKENEKKNGYLTELAGLKQNLASL